MRPTGADRVAISTMADNHTTARLPPRWFIRLFWIAHRCVYRWTGGRFGLWQPKPGGWGTIRLNTIGRRTGQHRSVIVGYFEDGPNLVTMAMNGWGDPEPAWWLNLQAHPDVTVDTVDGPRQVRRPSRPRRRARAPVGAMATARQEPRCLRSTPLKTDHSRDSPSDSGHEHENGAATSHQQRVVVIAGEEGRRHGHPNNSERPVSRTPVDLKVLFPGRYISIASFKRDGTGVRQHQCGQRRTAPGCSRSPTGIPRR